MTTPLSPLQVYAIDRHLIVRLGLGQLFAATDDLALAGSTHSGADFAARFRQHELPAIDVLVTDIDVPGASGFDVLGSVSRGRPGLPVVFYAREPADDLAVQLLRRGAAAVIPKERGTDELLAAIRAVGTTKTCASRPSASLWPGHTTRRMPHEALSQRESEVLLMYASSQSPSEIADTLSISPSTVSVYFRRIRDKLGVDRTGEIVTYAFRHGLVR